MINALVIDEGIFQKVEDLELKFYGKSFNVTLSRGVLYLPIGTKDAKSFFTQLTLLFIRPRKAVGKKFIFISQTSDII
jgi:hypothetical protein